MLKKLKFKFVVVNMTIVTIMICFIFGMFYLSTYRNLEHESIAMLQAMISDPDQAGFPSPPVKPDENDFRLPCFKIIIDEEGNVIETAGEFFDLSDDQTLDKIIDKALASGERLGSLKEYGLRYLIFDDPNGNTIVFADITRERAALKSIVKASATLGGLVFLLFLGISILLSRWAVKPVEDAWQKQKQFIADASHELKTPLTVIMTDAELLSSDDCQESEREKLSSSILAMSSQMRGLVESMLSLARIDASTEATNFAEFSLSEALSDAAMMFEPLFFENDRFLDYDIGSDILMTGNVTHMKQLADILLDNAVKYSFSGSETMLKLKKSGPKTCIIEVSDKGEHIEDQELEKLFNRFYRADKARAMNHSYGLGLSIAKNIAEEHKGRIWAESRQGVNSFFVELPCH